MGDLVKADYGLAASCRSEAQDLGCNRATVHKRRRGQDLPPFVRGIDGRVWPSRKLTPDQRIKRDKRIRQMLELGWPQTLIAERLHVGKGTVSRVAATTPRRRKAHKYSQRHWRDKLPLR